MAEVTAMRNNALPYPVYGLPWVITFPLLDADGDPISPSTPDSEISKNGDTFADCTNEATEIATSSGSCYLSLTGTELTTDVATIQIKSTGAKTTVVTLYPRKLVTIRTGTSASGGVATSTIVLDASASAVDDFYNGMIVAAVIDSVTEVRMITDYTGSTQTATVTPDWNTAPDNNDTFTIYRPDGVQIQQANASHWNSLATVALPLVPTTAGRSLDVTATGEAGIDWANIGSPTATQNLSGTTVASVSLVGSAAITLNSFHAETGLKTIRSNTAQNGTSTSITLDASASATTDFYKYCLIYLTGGTGAGQYRLGTAYDGTTKVLTITPAWATDPDNTSTFAILPAGITNVSAWRGSAVVATAVAGVPTVDAQYAGGTAWGSGAITANSIASNAITAAKIADGAIDAATFAADVDAEILSYIVDDATRIDASQLNTHTAITVAGIADGVWDEAWSGHLTAGTFGQAASPVRSNTAQAGGATTITLDASASATDDIYNYDLIFITAGTGAGQARYITDYNGTTKVATVASWQTNPSSDSVFVILPGGQIPGATAPTAGEVADAVWDEAQSGHTTAGTFGRYLDAQVANVEADTQDIQSRLPAALVSGRMDSNMQAAANGVITAAVISTGAIDADAVAADAVTEIQSGLATAASIAALNNLSSAQAQTAAESALQTYHLDHLIASADPGSVVADSSFLAKLVSKSATPSFASYSNQTDSLEAIRDRGDAAWITATGFSTHTAADVWAVATRVLTAGTNIQLPSNGLANVTAWTVDVTGNITGNLSGSVGSISGVTFPTNFASLGINASGHISRVVLVDTLTTYTSNTPQTGDCYARLGAPAGASVSADIAIIAADNPNRPTRGVQFDNHVFTMVDATDFNTPETGVTVTATISKDGGAFASCTNSVSEISGGFYKITLTATEMTADVVALKFTGTGCAQRNYVFRTQPT